MASDSVRANSRNSRPTNAAQEQDGSEYRDQRQADRQHGETHFARAAQGRLHARHVRPRDDGRCSPARRWRRRPRSRSRWSAPSARGCRGCSPADTSRRRCRGSTSAPRRWESAVARISRRNRNTTIVTRMTAISSVVSVSCSEERIVVLRSMAMVTLMSAGNAACRCGSSRLHAVDRVDDVGARLAEQDDQHRRLAVGQTEIAHVLDGIVHVGDVGELDRGAVAIGDDQRLVVRRLGRLVVGVDLIALVAVVDRCPSGCWRWPRPAPRARPPARCRI